MRNNRHIVPSYIDGKPYIVRLPSVGSQKGQQNEWDQIIETVGKNDSLLHFLKMYSWGQETANFLWYENICRISRGNSSACTRSFALAFFRAPNYGYRPVLEPLNKEENHSDLSGISDGSIHIFGTLYMDGSPIAIPSKPFWDKGGDIPDYIVNSNLFIGDSDLDPKKRIHWIKFGNKFIADRNLLKNISWDDLNSQGLVFGGNSKLLS